MSNTNDRVMLEELALEIATPLALAARTREGWEESDAMSETISTTLHKIGMPDEGLPGVRPHILKMVEDGTIAVHSARNNLHPVNVSDVTAHNFGRWYISREDADKVREHLQAKAQATPAAKGEPAPVTTPAQVTQNKLRLNSLDPAIDEAIKQAQSIELAAVYLKLKAMALDEVMPFTGELDGDALCYTDDENKPAKLTKDALGKRLKRRQTPPATVSRR